MNDNQPVPNPTLRDHVTQIGFNLSLTRRMIGVLDEIAHNERDRNRASVWAYAGHWVPGARSLGNRGLVKHCYAPSHSGAMPPYGQRDLTEHYRLTRAGWLIHDLLAEAGLVERVTKRKLRGLIAA